MLQIERLRLRRNSRPLYYLVGSAREGDLDWAAEAEFIAAAARMKRSRPTASGPLEAW